MKMKLNSGLSILIFGVIAIALVENENLLFSELPSSPNPSGGTGTGTGYSTKSNGTFTFSHGHTSTTATELQPTSKEDSKSLSSKDGITSFPSPTVVNTPTTSNLFTTKSSVFASGNNTASISAGLSQASDTGSVRYPNTTSSLSQNFTLASTTKSSIKQFTFPNATSTNNSTLAASKPGSPWKSGSPVFRNATRDPIFKNASAASIPETQPKTSFRVAAAATKAVFAHFMVGNTVHYSIAEWQNDIILARDAHIDGFALNIARGEETNARSIAMAFDAANSLGNGFKLMFSFDYAGRGSFGADEVIGLINQYKVHPAYFYRGSQPLVSTFEGPSRADDWPGIKAATGCFFIPSWSSFGAKKAVAAGGGTADGLFSWAGWPTGANDMFTTVDESYYDFLGGKAYMMPVSPWFYANMPGYRKNWIWRGDDLWFDRWQQVHSIAHQPDYLEIITWNDWGECHYIGPLRPNEYHAFAKENGNAPFNYALGYPHDGWREFLPYLIDTYKFGSAPITKEGVSVWYRTTRLAACPFGGTTGNTASQLQFAVSPALLNRDKIFFSALLVSAGTVTVRVGGTVIAGATWENTPFGGKGMYHGSVDFGNLVGTVSVTVTRGGTTVAAMTDGRPISGTCEYGVQNWNAWVGSSSGGAVNGGSVTTAVACIQGTGPGNYKIFCELTCKHDYCPPVCTCLARGTAIPPPTALAINACPKPGYDITYLGLCSFYCNRKSPCPTDICVVMPATFVCTAPPATAPLIPVCNAGNRVGHVFGPTCVFTCAFGFCPPEICDCEQVGSSAPAPPATTGENGWSIAGEDYGLCAWACDHGFCPPSVCGTAANGGGGKHISPYSATVIPFSATTVAATATFTLGGPVVSNVWVQPNSGNQNQPSGPSECDVCDLLRLITSTCCGTGGGVANPINILPNVPLPRSLILPIGFIPNQEITDSQGKKWPAGYPTSEEITLGTGHTFPFQFVLPAGSGLTNKNSPDEDDDKDDGVLYITSTFWEGPRTISCSFPCTIVLPHYPTVTTTWIPPPFTTTTGGAITVIPVPPIVTQKIALKRTTIISASGSDPTVLFFPVPFPKPICITITLPFGLGTIRLGLCPPAISPFPPTIRIPEVKVIPVPPGGTQGPVPVGGAPPPGEEEQEEEEEEEEDGESCQLYDSFGNSDSSGWSMDTPWIHSGGAPVQGPINENQPGAGTGTPTTKAGIVTVIEVVTATTVVTSIQTIPARPTQNNNIPNPGPDPDPPSPDPRTRDTKCYDVPPQLYNTLLKARMLALCSELKGQVISSKQHWTKEADALPDADLVIAGYISYGNCRFVWTESHCIAMFDSILIKCKGTIKAYNGQGHTQDNCGRSYVYIGKRVDLGRIMKPVPIRRSIGA